MHSATQNSSATWPDDDGAVQAALSNPLVLRQIFVCLPTNHLLSTCSLVNKFWNTQTRTFLRDHRKICVQIGPGYAEESAHFCEACTTLNKFCETLSHMNVIPINCLLFSFLVSLSPRSAQVILCKNNNTIENIFKIKLKTLAIHMKDIRLCCISPQLLGELLRKNSAHLQTLSILKMPVILEEILQDWIPQLPKLESLSIFGNTGWNSKVFHIKLFKKIPSLKSISLSSIFAIDAIPEARYYSLLTNFRVTIESDQDRGQCLQVAEMGPALKRLSAIYHTDRHRPMFPSYCTALQKLIDSSKNSLERFDVYFQSEILDLFIFLDFPTLNKVEYISIRTKRSSEELLGAIGRSVNYSRTFPALKEVHLTACIDSPPNITEGEEEGLDEHGNNPWTFTCATAAKLWLDMRLENFTLLQLKSTFPAIVSMTVYIRLHYVPPLWKIYQLWPDLEELTLHGESLPQMCTQRDSEFCGISEEEVGAYYDKDEEFLRNLHIVPIRPCILTLANLRRLTVDMEFPRSEAVKSDDQSRSSEQFVSKVTNCLVLQRFPLLKVNIKFCEYEDSDSSGSESDDDNVSSSSDEEG